MRTLPKIAPAKNAPRPMWVMVILALLATPLVPGGVGGRAQIPLLRSPLSVPDQAAADDAFPERQNGNGQAGSGGKAVAHYAGGVEIKNGKIRRQAPDGRLYRLGINGWEPTIGVDDENRVFFQARTPSLQPEVLRSTNEGDTWDIVSPKVAGAPTHPVSLDPILYLDKDTGRVFTNNIPPSLTCQPISFTDDAGESWTNTGICGHFDHQNIFTGPPVSSETLNDYPNLVYYCAINLVMLSGTSIATTCGKSLDGGLTWIHTGEPAYVTPLPAREDQTQTYCDGAVGHGYVGPDGTVFLPRVWCGQPFLAISHDEGLTWDQVQVSDIGGNFHEAGVAADADGNVYYTWMGSDNLPYLAISNDNGETWGEPMMIAPPGVVSASLPAMEMGDDGKLAIVYAGTTTKTDDDAEKLWNGYITITEDALAKRPVFYSGTINDPADPITRGRCEGIRCTTLGDFFDVAIGPDGTPWAAFIDGCDGGPDNCITTFEAVGVRGESIVGRLVGGPKLLTKKG